MTAVRNHNWAFSTDFIILSILLKGILHVSYAPEYESVADVRDKLKSRARDIRYRLKKLNESADVSIKRPTSDGCENEPLTKRSNLTDTNLSTQWKKRMQNISVIVNSWAEVVDRQTVNALIQ